MDWSRCFIVLTYNEVNDTLMCMLFPILKVLWKTPGTKAEIAKYTLGNFTLSYLLLNDKMNRTYQMHKVYVCLFVHLCNEKVTLNHSDFCINV